MALRLVVLLVCSVPRSQWVNCYLDLRLRFEVICPKHHVIILYFLASLTFANQLYFSGKTIICWRISLQLLYLFWFFVWLGNEKDKGIKRKMHQNSWYCWFWQFLPWLAVVRRFLESFPWLILRFWFQFTNRHILTTFLIYLWNYFLLSAFVEKLFRPPICNGSNLIAVLGKPSRDETMKLVDTRRCRKTKEIG